MLRAVEIAGALGAYRDALALIDGSESTPGAERLPRLLAGRADLLMATGDPQTAGVRRPPLTTGTDARLVRARLARAATAAGDVKTSRAAVADLDRRVTPRTARSWWPAAPSRTSAATSRRYVGHSQARRAT